MDSPVENFYRAKSHPSFRILLFTCSRERGLFCSSSSVSVSISRNSLNFFAFTKDYVICDVRSHFQEV